MSTAGATREVEATLRVAPGLDNYFAAVRDTNPFAANRVTEPSAYDVDVATIHAAGFGRLIELAGQAMARPSAIGVALLGGAGVGKSHLLSRLFRWANERRPDGGTRACYVYLHNVLADPERLPRYLLKYVVSRLSNGGHGPLFEAPLFGFLDRAIRHALAASGVTVDKIEDHVKQAADAYLSHFARSPEARATYVTLLQFWRFARPDKADDPKRRLLAGSALAWLSGDEVDPALAAQLGFKVNDQDPVMLRDDQEVQNVLQALAELAHVSRQPFILCIDQFENLDPDKIKPFSRFLHALLDRTSNLLAITSGVKQTLLEYKDERIIPEASWDRIAEYTVELRRITAADARKILEARLERFHDPFLDLNDVRLQVHNDTLFPLGRAWLDERLADGLEFRARDILNWARDAWEDEQGRLSHLGSGAWIKGWPHSEIGPPPGPTPSTPDVDALIDAAVDRKIEEQIAQHRLQPGSLPPDAGNLAGLVESLLGECAIDGLPYTFRAVERMKKKGPKLPPYDVLVREHRDPDGREVRTGVSFVTNIGVSAAAALRRLLQDDETIDHRMLVTDQERRPLKVGPQGAEHYRALEKLGTGKFEHLKLNFEEYA